MRRFLKLSLLLSLVVANRAAGQPPQSVEPVSEATRSAASYAMGYKIGEIYRLQTEDLDIDELIAGLRDAYTGAASRIAEADMDTSLRQYQLQRSAVEAQRLAAEPETNLAAARAFLEANGKRPSVVSLPSGAQYEVLRAGEGPTPGPSDRVTVHYRGMRLDGTEFDNTYSRGSAMTFQLDQVLDGWTEALQHMPAGSKWKLFLPPELAYGDQGAGGVIPPNAALIFEIELLAVAPAAG